MSWRYDRYEWWVDAIHQSVCPLRPLTPYDEVLKCTRTLDPDELDASYAPTLRLIADGRVDRDRVKETLFRAKALRKWRLSDAAQAETRRAEAIAGFYVRNDAAGSMGPIPFPYAGAMRRILRSWLPSVSCDVVGTLGPLEKACAEKHTAPVKVRHFAEWCSATRDIFAGSLQADGSYRIGEQAIQPISWPEVPLEHVDAYKSIGRLSAVAKTRTKDRLITVEPLYRKYAQQWVREMLLESIHRGPLRGSALDQLYVDAPAVQRRLALQASRTQTLGTIDLSDASDRIALHHVLQVFPPWVCYLLEQTRCEKVQDDIGIRAEPTPLKMYAGMGNATTFVVETLFFSAFVKAYAWAHGLKTRVSVFGDDVICSSDVASRLSDEDFEFFKVNRDKTFFGADQLRESCGIFAFAGEDVTVPKVDGYPDSYEGRVGICDLHRRLFASRDAYCQRLSWLIASGSNLVNWPFVVEGYPSIDDCRCEYSALPETRRDIHYQCLRAKVMLPQRQTVDYVADDQIAARRNTDTARTWLWGTLASLVTSRPSRIVSTDSNRGRAACSVFSFPNGKVKYRQVWSPIH